jgi:hypothetical protein
MRRSRKPFRAVRSDEGSNPSPSAFQGLRGIAHPDPFVRGFQDHPRPPAQVRPDPEECTDSSVRWRTPGKQFQLSRGICFERPGLAGSVSRSAARSYGACASGSTRSESRTSTSRPHVSVWVRSRKGDPIYALRSESTVRARPAATPTTTSGTVKTTRTIKASSQLPLQSLSAPTANGPIAASA